MVQKLLTLLFLCSAVAASAQEELDAPVSPVSHDELFVDGVIAYDEERWSDCVLHMRRAMFEYDRLVRARAKCYDKCGREESRPPPPPPPRRGLLPPLLQRLALRSTCIEHCKEGYVGARPAGGTPYSVNERMATKETYNYLQVALFKVCWHLGRVRHRSGTYYKFVHVHH